ncbi:MAG: GDP-mannose 4,6-dehydratase [Candidatus Levyibacteriota bacterium]|nr:MAG: GDP-mannose 4,6-dehydratase [Candidatus Levybacteria bacterium]
MKEGAKMSFWQQRVVLVTGASGFVGSRLVNLLNKKKSKVIALSNKEIKSIRGIIDVRGSVENFQLLNEIIKKYKVNTIFHLAAQSIVEIGQDNPIKTFEVNIRGTWNILECARENNIQKVVIASTVHVYGDNPKVPFKEEYFPQPSRPYETSKACADLLAQSFADTYDLSVEIPRFVNIYGPGDLNFSRLIPKVIKSILQGKQPEVWDVGSIRDFLYIDDAITAYLMIAEKRVDNKKRLRIFNFGTGNQIKIYDLVQKIIQIMAKGIKVRIEQLPQDRSNEIKKQYVSIAKAKRELGWYPKVTLDNGLSKTITWYQGNSHLFI